MWEGGVTGASGGFDLGFDMNWVAEMENAEIRSERKRGRKRKRIDVQNVEVDKDGKKRVMGRGKALVGRYVRKEFAGSGMFLGKIMFYDSGLYRVDYEDGDCEDLESSEVKEFLIEDSDINDEWLERKKKLDELVSSKGVKVKGDLKVEEMVPVESSKVVVDDTVKSKVENLAPVESAKGFGDDRVELSSVSEVSNPGCELSSAVANHEAVGVQVGCDGSSDSMTDSCEDDMEQEYGLEVEVPSVPRPELPLSSMNVGIPEEYVSHLFSVYSFLRSFSIQLFLSPFKLDDFVGSLNCAVPNTLLDSIHFALLRALRRHFEKLSSEGSELASKCLRGVDWSLLDTLTWPVYVVHYLLIMGYTDGPEWKGFYIHALKKDYYTLSVGRKLAILQILCDAALDTEELRTEIDMREELEVGMDSEIGAVVAPANGPRRVHPRNSKTSACKDQEVREFIGQNHETNSYYRSGQLSSKDHCQDVSSELDEDSNGDECRLCGMDGTLICCDGCPASYHSRCIGVSKMFIPDGAWYCPECSIKTSGPRIVSGTTLKGADMFGTDIYEQAFVGACDHLLVLNASMNSDSCLRYYNQNDILNVLQTLQSNEQHISMYSEICKGIIQHWGIPADVVSFSGTSVNDEQKEDAKSTFLGTEGHSVSEITENEDTLSCVSGSSLGSTMPNNTSSFNTMMNLACAVRHGNEGTTEEQAGPPVKSKVPGEIQVKSSMISGPLSDCADPLGLQQKEKSNVAITTCTSRNTVGNLKERVGSPSVVTKLTIWHRETKIVVGDRDHPNSANGFLFMGSSFKSQGYINNYLHGEFAASAAANLAVLSSEENQVSESYASDRRKLISADVSLQVKAFSSAAMRFFWPHTEKKLIEVPRERCSWCLSCKAPVVSKRGCLLNAAASNAIKGAMKILAGLHPLKSGEGTIPGIATYIMLMEESLSGLTIGPFQTASFRRQWCGEVEQARSLSALKKLLLELEENIRPIALSGDWLKLVDGWSAESSIIQNATAVVGSTQKRKPGRRGRKPSVIIEVNADDGQDTLTDFTWWRGSMLSALLFQKGSLEKSLVKKAARQGGSRRIPGIYYAEGSETPKRSRRFVWRTAVEMSSNTSQLALQVRYLDFYVRWNDLVRPDLSIQDTKAPETEASAFRNAYVCDKKIVENEIRYGIAFGSQKHLPSRVMKNIIDVEQSQDGKEKYWFPETRIPLYLIKEYEEHCMKVLLPSANMPMNVGAKLQSRRLRASRKDVFSYLERKRDNMEKHDCAVCKLDVLLGNAVKCSVCEGFYHEKCTISSMVQISEEVEFSITCKQCYQNKAVSQTSHESPTSPLLLQGQEFPNDTMVNLAEKIAAGNLSSPSVDALQHPSNLKPTNASKSADKSKRKLASWGLIWRKKNCEDTGIDFRLKNILLKGNQDMDWSRVVCHLCRKPYNPDLMYIRCQTCANWYHAEAVELEESKIFELVGFKCCRCRRIRSPVCPYLDADNKKQFEEKKIRIRPPKQESQEKNAELVVVSQHVNVDHANTIIPKKEEVAYITADDPLLFTHSRAEQHAKFDPNANFEWNTGNEWNTGMLSGSGPQKLPVRRHNKRETDEDLHSLASDSSHIDLSTFGGNVLNPANESLLPPVEWGVSNKGFDEGVMFDYEGLNYEDMEFEPQTYFSFNELLASDDGGPLDGVESSGNVAETWENFHLFPSDEVTHASADQQEPMISVEHVVNMVPCKICCHTEPYPDLSCQMCGLQIHSHCSPWVEQSFKDDGWRCGNCREWQ